MYTFYFIHDIDADIYFVVAYVGAINVFSAKSTKQVKYTNNAMRTRSIADVDKRREFGY